MLQYKHNVQLAGERDSNEEELDCSTGKCKPKTTTGTTTEFFIVKDTCDKFTCPGGMFAKETPPADCGDDACTAGLCCDEPGNCGDYVCEAGTIKRDDAPTECGS